jgi:tetratricopeptide (TPR) repeat protein
MKAILWLLFLSFYWVGESACQSEIPIGHSVSCDSKLFRDSLIRKYVDSGAEKLPNLYNNPSWDKYLDSILAICPDIAEAYQLKAVPAIKNGEYIKAYMLDEKAAQLDSQQFIPYLGFLLCIFTKDYQGAITHFNESVRILPGGDVMDHSFYFYLGICYLKLRQFSQAEKNFSLDISSQKTVNPAGEVHFNSILYMGLLKMECYQADSALMYFKDCLRIYQDLPEANYYLALIYKQKNKSDSAVKYLEIAQQSLQDGYSMNEDNQFYVNYPYQITQYEIVELLNLCKK